MRITENEQEIRRNRMIHAAYDLFCQRGIDGITLAQIAETADVSVNSIFRYFDSKAELAKCAHIILWREIANHILAGNKEALKDAKDGWEEISILLHGFKDLYENYSQYILFDNDYKSFLIRNKIVLPVKLYDEVMEPIWEPFVAAIKKGQSDGSINKKEPPETQLFSSWCVLRGYVEEIVLYDQIYGGENPWERRFDSIWRHVTDSLKAHDRD